MPKNDRAQRAPAPLWASQNFLTGGADIRRLLALTDISPRDHVLEIGPGKGHITRELLPRCGRLTAVELDPRLCAGLRERFGGSLGLREGDFLKAPLPKGPYKVFSNIPFSKTTAIISKLTGTGDPPEAAWLIVELGAAKRFSGGSVTALSLRPWFDVRIAARIPREKFHPAPSVDAALLELRRKPVPDLPPSSQRAFRDFLTEGKRRGLTALLTRRQISAALRLEGLPPIPPDGNTRYVQWLCLFRCYLKYRP